MNPNKNQNLYIAALIVAAIGITLLVGNRLNATWAGGTGFEKHVCAFASTEIEIKGDLVFCRGEIISTMPDSDIRTESPVLVTFGDSAIYMDENTEVKIIDGRKGHETINVIQGRVVVKGNLTIETREIDTIVNGTTSFVHYSWLDKIQIVNIEGETRFTIEGYGQQVHALEMTTLESYKITEIEFSPESSTAAEFYNQVLN